MWGGSDNKGTNEVLETRKQWFPESLALSREEEVAIFKLFRNANFKKTSGELLNLRLSYAEEKDHFLKMGPTQLDNLEKALMGTMAILENRQSPPPR